MKKLNTYTIYEFCTRITPLLTLKHSAGMTRKDLLFPLLNAKMALETQVEPSGFFSPSLRRSAGALLRAINNAGVDSTELMFHKLEEPVSPHTVSAVVQRTREFETVLANELPGLATYAVSTKGIYSTDDLISHAEHHIPESMRRVLSEKASEDLQQAGKCLAFEVATASAFHMWRAVESVMDSYHEGLTGKTFAEAGVTRNWGQYISALQNAAAQDKITVFLDHIRKEYRNPISHPEDTLDPDEAFALFGAAMSAITQMLRAITEAKKPRPISPPDGLVSLAAVAGSGAKNQGA